MGKAFKWSEEAWNEIIPIYEKILSLPFIKELREGVLPREKFTFYMQQDSIYLKSYVQVLSHIASRMTDEHFRSRLLEFAVEGISVEKAIHQFFLSGQAVGKGTPSPTCLLYTSFLKAQAYSAVEVEMASVLPCFWVYQRVGEAILAAGCHDNNPYERWIETYADKRFLESTLQAIEICDSLASVATDETRRLMTEAFVMGSKMEYLFWESAYNMEKWEI